MEHSHRPPLIPLRQCSPPHRTSVQTHRIISILKYIFMLFSFFFFLQFLYKKVEASISSATVCNSLYNTCIYVHFTILQLVTNVTRFLKKHRSLKDLF